MPQSVLDRTVVYDKPFAYIVATYKAKEFCFHCMRKPEVLKLSLCSKCQFARYCDKSCQRAGWKVHKVECARLNEVYPHLPLTEVLFLSRICDRIAQIELHGDTTGVQEYRRFEDLLSHKDDIMTDSAKMEQFEKIYAKAEKFRGKDTPQRDHFFDVFCKTWINSHSIHTSAGTEIGMALDLGISRYDHSCRPNCAMVFNGFEAMIRPLQATVDATDPSVANIAYVDVGRSRFRRAADLRKKWYFECACVRCVDPDDRRLTSIRCSTTGCEEPLLTTEDAEPMNIACPSCKRVTDEERVTEAQTFMKSLPSQFSFSSDTEEVEKVRKYMEEARRLLHPENIYYGRLLTVYLQIGGAAPLEVGHEMQKLVYQNYKRCFPEQDRHIGYQLLHLVKSLIESGKREEAVPYAYEAMTIFEVCFGLNHPYYLQTLALWTFLDKGDPKTDDELMALMNFNYNRPVDLSSILNE